MKPFTLLTIIFLGLLAAAQLVRSMLGWQVIVNGLSIPVWASGLACVVAAVLAVMLWRESRR